ncbi:MAG TPA: SLBB domain-containing protein [Ignavibacteria bacterium]|nr:SLBB domain-containing protein [Ignavibacteria bacterium]
MKVEISKIFIIFCLFLPAVLYSQVDRQKVGNDGNFNQQGGFYNYGDKDKVNIDVNIWGFVKFPGKYLIPKGSNVQDLISYSGGPVIESNLEGIVLYRPKNDSLKISKDKVLNLNYDDLFWKDNVSSDNKINPVLVPGDVLIVKGEPRYFTRDDVSFILSISAVLISLGILVVTAISVGKN